MLAAALRACARRMLAATPLLDLLFGATAAPMRQLSLRLDREPVLVELCAACGGFAHAGEIFALWRCYCGAHSWRGLLCVACESEREPRLLRFAPSACGVVRCEGGEA